MKFAVKKIIPKIFLFPIGNWLKIIILGRKSDCKHFLLIIECSHFLLLCLDFFTFLKYFLGPITVFRVKSESSQIFSLLNLTLLNRRVLAEIIGFCNTAQRLQQSGN